MNLRNALELAIQSVQEAGCLLRTASWSASTEDGLREDIYQRLQTTIQQATPEWTCVAEGSPLPPAASQDPYWLLYVDDPAKNAIGDRTEALSLALVRDGLPVLGVVHAPCHPDDDGDLIAWAEGFPSLLRGGTQAVGLAPCPDALGRHSVVLVPPEADRQVGTTLGRCAPARYRTVASLPYRLALLAGDEGDACVILGDEGQAPSPSGRALPLAALAAGQALLRARGGVLLDSVGKTVRYDGDAVQAPCVAASPAVAPTLLEAFTAPPSPTAPQSGRNPEYDPSYWFPAAQEDARTLLVGCGWPRTRRDPGLLRRAQGVMLGQLAGDSLGSLVEFMTAEDIARIYKVGPDEFEDGGTWNLIAGQPTDDSELALAMARSIIHEGRYDPDAVFSAYRGWLDSHPFDVGTTTSAGLRRPSRHARGCRLESEANGALMRVSPLGLHGVGRPDAALEEARQDAMLTHPSAMCQEASVVFLAALMAGLDGANRTTMYQVALEHSTDLTRTALERASTTPPPLRGASRGWVLTALNNAFYRLLHAESLREVLISTVRMGGDTDTNGAIAGALAGAYFGRAGIPAGWLRLLLSCRTHPAYRPSHNPRPTSFWPVDALGLAERLLP